MKTSIGLVLCLVALCCTARAEQARRFVLLEQFTQAGCGPCADFNPGFEKDIVHRNPGSVHHIAYHTWWPGSDPMYDFNRNHNDARTNYYQIGAVPQVIILGDNTAADTFEGSQELIDSIAAAGSPLGILTTESESNGTREVSVRLTAMGDMPAGSYRLRVAVVECLVEYPFPPGSNGERSFPNVFRTMLPSVQGMQIQMPERGQSSTYSFSYPLDAEWNGEVYVVAFVQNDETLEVINSGSSLDLKAELATSALGRLSSGSSPVTFDLATSNALDSERTFRVRLTSDAPAGWNASLLNNGEPVQEFVVGAGQARSLTLAVTPSDEAAVGVYTVELSAVDEPQLIPSVQKLYVVHRVANLVVNNDGRWNADYRGPLDGVNTQVGVIDAEGFGKVEDVWQNVRSIYYNAGWSFPTLTSPVATALQRFIDRGGNLLIAGQDIGWDQVEHASKIISDDFTGVTASGTPATRRFYQEYLQAGFYDDGTNGAATIGTAQEDEVFGIIAPSGLNNVHHVLSPDVIVPTGNAVPVLVYNGNKDDIAGQRLTRGSAKIVYLAFGLEQLADANLRNTILTTAYRWFEGIITDVEFDGALKSAVVCVPNPAGEQAALSFPALAHQARLAVMDMHGAEVAGIDVARGSVTAHVSTRELAAGVYLFSIAGPDGIVYSGTFRVVR